MSHHRFEHDSMVRVIDGEHEGFEGRVVDWQARKHSEGVTYILEELTGERVKVNGDNLELSESDDRGYNDSYI